MTPSDLHTLRPVTLLVCALGGEGGGVLADWLVAAARRAGYPVQATSVPGVAQRTGATTYYLECFPVPESALGGRRPVFGLTPQPGRLDLLVSSELLETVRQIGHGMASAEHTRVITSSSRALTNQEKMPMGDGRRDTASLLAVVRAHSQSHHVLDMAALTRQAGTVVSSVMFGCVAASGVLPFSRELCEAVVGEGGGAAAQASLRGFALGYDTVTRQREQGALVADLLLNPEQSKSDPPGLSARRVPEPAPADLAAFPPATRERIALGWRRCADYQDPSYAALYLQRLGTVWAAERAADPTGSQAGAATHEAARWLALWMAFDDVVRVAALKSRATRWDRVRTEVRAGEHDLLRVWDHFKPGVPELAGLLPAALAERLLRRDRARVARGQEPWSLALKVGTHSVGGLLALRLLAACRRLRPLGSRYATEQALITRWLDAVVRGLGQDPALGLEIARCGQLVKGYGSTNERGKANLLHVLDHLAFAPTGPDAQARARAVGAARAAALQDEAGTALDATLRAHGAPARPVPEQPIRWMRRPRQAATP